jgi:hypothetical protein
VSNNESRYNINSPKVQSLLLGVHRSGEKSYFRIDADGKHYVIAITAHRTLATILPRLSRRLKLKVATFRQRSCLTGEQP